MAKLPARQKVTLLLFRRVNPDQVLIVEREARRALRWALPSTEVTEGETPRDAARHLASQLVEGALLQDLDLRMPAEFRVKEGPSAGEWTERFLAVEAAPDARALDGQWVAHYEAKTAAGADAPRVREAITKLRETARLKP